MTRRGRDRPRAIDPAASTADDEARALVELRELEPIFHRAGHGTSRRDFEAMTDPDYWEVGASGRSYDRATVLEALERRYADPAYEPMAGLELSDLAGRRISADVWLVTYRLRQPGRRSRRLTVWRRTGGRWVALYHQGTIEADADVEEARDDASTARG